MRSGDIDGKGIIYDHYGRLVTYEGESLVRVVRNTVGYVLPNWGSWVRGRAVINTFSGKGDWWITDKRVVFIRKPNSKGVKRWRTTPLEVAGGLDEILRIRYVLRNGGYDYCEVLYDDVRFYKMHRNRKRGELLLMVSGRKYQMYFDNDMFVAMLPFLRQRGIEAH